MNISLTPELERLVQDRVSSGMYNSASEVVREALRLMKNHDDLREIRLAELRAEIQKGFDAIDRGDCTEIRTPQEHAAFFEDIKVRGRKRLAERKAE